MSVPAPAPQWLRTGQEIFPAMLAAIHAARESVRLETYIYTDGKIGRKFREALTHAARRGVRVSVLVDALGCWLLPDTFFEPLIAAGGTVHRFNPLRLWRFGVRDHRKLLVCDGRIAFAGGFNLADEYDGDGVNHGWCDLGVRVENNILAGELAASFDELFALADFRRKPLLRLRAFKRRRKASVLPAGTSSLSNLPGPDASPLRAALLHDLARAHDVRIITAYFLPTRKLRRALLRVARRGGRVQLILAGKSDVLVAQLAGRNLYRRLLSAGVEIYEYQPQILHAKLVVADQVAYAGSANFDVRSLKLNYEVMLRFEAETAAAARNIFDDVLKHCRKIELPHWRASQSFWQRWQQHWAHFLLTRLDVFCALRQFQALEK